MPDTSRALFFLPLGPLIVWWQYISKMVVSQVKKEAKKNLPGLETCLTCLIIIGSLDGVVALYKSVYSPRDVVDISWAVFFFFFFFFSISSLPVQVVCPHRPSFILTACHLLLCTMSVVWR